MTRPLTLTILAISHQTALAKIADKTYHIKNGIIVAEEKPAGNGLNLGNVVDKQDTRLQATAASVKTI